MDTFWTPVPALYERACTQRGVPVNEDKKVTLSM